MLREGRREYDGRGVRPDPIVVAGDARIDWLRAPEGDSRARLLPRPGGALLLADYLRQLVDSRVASSSVDSPAPASSGAFPQRLVELDRFPVTASGGAAGPTLYRALRSFDLTGVAVESLAVGNDEPAAELIVLHDDGGGFGETPGAWPAALTGTARPVVVLNASRAAMRGDLWTLLQGRHAGRLVAIVDGDALREDANVSRGLSWERTAMDLVWQLASNQALRPLAACAHLVVRLGLDAAVHVAGGRARLWYDPAVAEGAFKNDRPGESIGSGEAFAAAIASAVARDGLEGVGSGVEAGMRLARLVHHAGFGDSPGSVAEIPRLAADARPQWGRLTSIDVPAPGAETADPGFWCILATLSNRRLEQIAYDLVLHGDAEALADVPVGRFGGLKTIDRAEIESFRSIHRLMASYCGTENPGRPLSIAVFGPPGSGKSFGVTQVAQSVAPGRVEKREFNLSQFASPDDLVPAFHWVRDVALSGRIALAVFDEFDSSLQGVRLGWLKSFLAPMQDGAFKEGEAMHPLGRAIFVFAGGTCATFSEFCCDLADTAVVKAFRDAKGPDFASRLRGYVNVLGPNPAGEGDRFHLVRRAVLLRSLVTRKLPQIVGGKGQVRIDPGVLRALIKVPAYRHGARSMEAILDMSTLAGRTTFDQAALPPAPQLAMHTDAELFSKLVSRDVLFGAGRERLARAIHERYRASQRERKAGDDPALGEWDQLSDSLRESNRRQADHIPEKLARVGCGFAPALNGSSSFDGFTPQEIEHLSEMEHERFVAERRAAGWTDGPRDPAAKRTPYLVPWSSLEEQVREFDREAVRAIPSLMAEAGFEIYRLE